LHTTFDYQPRSDTWRLTIDDVKDGKTDSSTTSDGSPSTVFSARHAFVRSDVRGCDVLPQLRVVKGRRRRIERDLP
jgi:hypothetical protein